VNSKYIRLNQKINQVVKAPGDQGKIVAMAVAFAVSALSALPSSPVDDLSQFYNLQVQQPAIVKISQIGEGVIFASKTALEYLSVFWKQRYYSAHPAVTMEAVHFPLAMNACVKEEARQAFDFATIMSGGLVTMSIETAKFLNKYKIEIATIANDMYWQLKDEDLSPVNDSPSPVAY
jgi:hypothetical protein